MQNEDVEFNFKAIIWDGKLKYALSRGRIVLHRYDPIQISNSGVVHKTKTRNAVCGSAVPQWGTSVDRDYHLRNKIEL